MRLVSERLTAIRAGDRAALARGITLLESTRADHQREAEALLDAALPFSGKAIRLGISGVPGVGKSTLIETLGMKLLVQGHRVAVLAVDPSSQRRGGSILGDKTRMQSLSRDPRAYVRPSPSSGQLGGVARMTRESIILLEAAGFDVVLVETVGVGQSETEVAEMSDCFLVLMLPGAGDELQGIKKGVLELADIIAVNKADGTHAVAARNARACYERAFSILQPGSSWKPVAMTISALQDSGIDKLWATVISHREQLQASGELQERRERQRQRWLDDEIEKRLLQRLQQDAKLANHKRLLEQQVASGERSVRQAARELVEGLLSSNASS